MEFDMTCSHTFRYKGKQGEKPQTQCWKLLKIYSPTFTMTVLGCHMCIDFNHHGIWHPVKHFSLSSSIHEMCRLKTRDQFDTQLKCRPHQNSFVLRVQRKSDRIASDLSQAASSILMPGIK